jgi:diadenosine tetraphosphate (Ap4A) HIT family hydrolase
MNACSLCSPNLAPRLDGSKYWRLILNHNQRFLGACFWVLNRHIETITALMIEEWSDLQLQLIRATRALTDCFQPDHFNYAFLQNQDRHVHMHIYPRYAHSRLLEGILFEDTDYPSHYTVPALSRVLTSEQYNLIVHKLQNALLTTNS